MYKGKVVAEDGVEFHHGRGEEDDEERAADDGHDERGGVDDGGDAGEPRLGSHGEQHQEHDKAGSNLGAVADGSVEGEEVDVVYLCRRRLHFLESLSHQGRCEHRDGLKARVDSQGWSRRASGRASC